MDKHINGEHIGLVSFYMSRVPYNMVTIYTYDRRRLGLKRNKFGSGALVAPYYRSTPLVLSLVATSSVCRGATAIGGFGAAVVGSFQDFGS